MVSEGNTAVGPQLKVSFYKHMACLPLTKLQTRTGGGPTIKIDFTNGIWRVYHWQNSKTRLGGGSVAKIRFTNSIWRFYH